LAVNFDLILVNGVVQLMGVASIAPFLAVASSEGGVPWLGWHHHVTLVSLAFAFLRQEHVRTKKNSWCDAAADPAGFTGGVD